MALVGCFPQKQSRLQFVKTMWKQLLIMTVLDILGTTMTLVGQLYLGSGLYIILYSSLTIWNAFGNRILLKRKFNWIQIVGIIVVFIGLGVSGLAGMDSTDFAIGVTFTLLGTIFHSSTYWLNEFFTTNYGIKLMSQTPLSIKKKHKLTTDSITELNTSSMKLMASFVGIFEIPVYLIYELAVTLPNWQEWVVDQVAEKNGQIWEIIVLYIAYTLNNLIHMYSQYASVPKLGSVTVGLSKSLSTVIVFFLSHLLFCSIPGEENQCINGYKVLSLIIVVFGVCFYSYGASKQTSIEKELNSQKESLLQDYVKSEESKSVEMSVTKDSSTGEDKQLLN